MRLGKYLSGLTKPELEEIEKQLNLTEDEEEVFKMLAKKKSLVEISDKLQISIPSVSRRISEISIKIKGCDNVEKMPIAEKLNLSMEEASQYSGIGINKLYKLTNEPTCTYVLWVGKRRLIKRKEFEKYLEKVLTI